MTIIRIVRWFGIVWVIAFFRIIIIIFARRKPMITTIWPVLHQNSIAPVIRPCSPVAVIIFIEATIFHRIINGSHIFLQFIRTGFETFINGTIDGGHFVRIWFALRLDGDHRRWLHITRGKCKCSARVQRNCLSRKLCSWVETASRQSRIPFMKNKRHTYIENFHSLSLNMRTCVAWIEWIGDDCKGWKTKVRGPSGYPSRMRGG